VEPQKEKEKEKGRIFQKRKTRKVFAKKERGKPLEKGGKGGEGRGGRISKKKRTNPGPAVQKQIDKRKKISNPSKKGGWKGGDFFREGKGLLF